MFHVQVTGTGKNLIVLIFLEMLWATPWLVNKDSYCVMKGKITFIELVGIFF